jgi:hypothetical protein
MSLLQLRQVTFDPCIQDKDPDCTEECDLHAPVARLRNRIRESNGQVVGQGIFLLFIVLIAVVISIVLVSMFRLGGTALAPLPILTPFVAGILTAVLKYNDFIIVPVKLSVMRGLHQRAIESCNAHKKAGSLPAEIGDYLGK